MGSIRLGKNQAFGSIGNKVTSLPTSHHFLTCVHQSISFLDFNVYVNYEWILSSDQPKSSILANTETIKILVLAEPKSNGKKYSVV